MKKAIFSYLKMVFLLALIIVLDIPAKLVLLSCKRGLDQCSKAADIPILLILLSRFRSALHFAHHRAAFLMMFYQQWVFRA
ncbi:hypothetical protein G8B17_03895 [Limosilactobacillus mucosae]|nr:hypothetical protein G8B17_03895 [Limosilactobacillus mucosae]